MGEKYSIKNLIKKAKKINNIEYFILILAIAIVVSLINNMFSSSEKRGEITTSLDTTTYTADSKIPTNTSNSYEDYETRLKSILSTIQGAGQVEVMITYISSKEIVPATNTVKSSTETEEQDINGGIRKVSQTDINTQPVSLNSVNGSEPLITKEIEPTIKGVIIVAQGADDIKVRLELQRAVQTVLGINSNQVEVFDMDDSLNGE